MSRTTARILGGLGRFLIGLGVLILLFAVFQLWGTGLAEARAQTELAGEFHQLLAAARALEAAETEAQPDLEPGPVVLRPDQVPEFGQAVGQLTIPAIGVTKTFVEGTGRDILRSGPGHYRTTPLPGQPGNAAIAGHRTTHGAPFFDIDKLVPGDEIRVETLQGQFTYVVEGHDDGHGNEIGHFIVHPSEVGVISDNGDNRLTLTACHPRYSAAQRIIVTATLVGEPAPARVVPAAAVGGVFTGELAAEDVSTVSSGEGVGDDPELAASENPPPGGIPVADPSNTVSESTVAQSLGWQPAYAGPTAAWAAATAAIGLAGWLLGRRWRRGPAYAMALPFFALALFTCFTNLDKFIPAV